MPYGYSYWVQKCVYIKQNYTLLISVLSRNLQLTHDQLHNNIFVWLILDLCCIKSKSVVWILQENSYKKITTVSTIYKLFFIRNSWHWWLLTFISPQIYFAWPCVLIISISVKDQQLGFLSFYLPHTENMETK